MTTQAYQGAALYHGGFDGGSPAPSGFSGGGGGGGYPPEGGGG
jgi:hypothetical protein